MFRARWSVGGKIFLKVEGPLGRCCDFAGERWQTRVVAEVEVWSHKEGLLEWFLKE